MGTVHAAHCKCGFEQEVSVGGTTLGSDDSVFTQTGSFSTDGSTRMGSTATGLGSVFNERNEDKFGFDEGEDDKW